MPDDESMLGQNLVDVRNEERIFRCENPEQDWIDEQQRASRTLTAEERADIDQELQELADLIATPPLDIVHMGRRREYVSRAEAELRRLQRILDA